MRTPASIFKHPIHPMLIVFPIGLWIFSLACDLTPLAGASGDAWSSVAFFSMIGGLVGALCAAVPGFIDLLFYKGGAPPAQESCSDPYGDQSYRRRAVRDKYLAARQRFRKFGNEPPVVLSVIGVARLFVSGWLGGQMVHVYAVCVEGRE